MRIIINERQLKLLQQTIDEAVKNKDYGKSLGKFILNFYDNIKKGENSVLTTANNAKIVLKCVSDNNNLFKFEVIQDTSKILKNWKFLEIKINPGDGDAGGTEQEYLLNKNVIEIPENKNGVNLIFTVINNSGGKKSGFKLNNIKSVELSNSQEPKPEEPKPEESKPEEETLKSGKDAYKEIINDPLLRKAFFKEPSFWETFKAELTGKKAVGTGIMTALDILDKYNLRNLNEKISNKFIPEQKVTIKFLKDYDIKFSEKSTEKVNTYSTYEFFVKKRKSGNKTVLQKKDDPNKTITITKELDEEGDNIFLTTIEGNNYKFKVIDDEYNSPGYVSDND